MLPRLGAPAQQWTSIRPSLVENLSAVSQEKILQAFRSRPARHRPSVCDLIVSRSNQVYMVPPQVVGMRISPPKHPMYGGITSSICQHTSRLNLALKSIRGALDSSMGNTPPLMSHPGVGGALQLQLEYLSRAILLHTGIFSSPR